MHASFDWKAMFAARVLDYGGVIAYPTEAVWGLGADPFQRTAVEKILDLKSRPMHKGLILISGQAEHFLPYLEPLEQSLIDRFFSVQDRPTTWLVPDVRNQIPYWVKGEHSSVAMRLTTHPVCAALTHHFGGAIISTSANPASKASARSLYEVKCYFQDKLDYCLSAPLGGAGQASQIRDLQSDEVIRV
jgi:L-threonylcarbamoyladenylate synthase